MKAKKRKALILSDGFWFSKKLMERIMLKNMIKSLLFLTLVGVFALSTVAQSQKANEFGQILENAISDAEKSAVVDEEGRIIQVEIKPSSQVEKQIFRLDYDKNEISAITRADGLKITILRNNHGKIEGFMFPDGGRVVLEQRSADPNHNSIPNIRIIRPYNTYNKIAYKPSNLSPKKGSMLDDCSRAINTAGAATTVASVTCATIGGPACAAALIAASVAIYNAYEVCNQV